MNFKIDDPNCTSEYDGDIEIPELGKWYAWEEVMTLAVFANTLAGYGFVYVYYDMVNKKYYVGVCKQSVRARARQHYNKPGKSSQIDLVIKDIGCNRILICIVKVCKTEDLGYFEDYFIDSLNTMCPNGYNSRKSGYRNINSNIQEMLARELPKERLLELLNSGYTYCTIANTMLSIKISDSTLSAYGKSLGIVLTVRGRLTPNKLTELTSKGYSNREIAQELGIKDRNAIAKVRRRYNIPSIRTPGSPRPVLRIDINSGVILDRYLSIVSASQSNGMPESTMKRKIRNKVEINGAYFIREEDYLKQQRSVTQAVEGA